MFTNKRAWTRLQVIWRAFGSESVEPSVISDWGNAIEVMTEGGCGSIGFPQELFAPNPRPTRKSYGPHPNWFVPGAYLPKKPHICWILPVAWLWQCTFRCLPTPFLFNASPHTVSSSPVQDRSSFSRRCASLT